MPGERTAAAQPAEVPMFEPDPDLIDHLEGNEREAERYREHARRSLEEARREWAERHPPPQP